MLTHAYILRLAMYLDWLLLAHMHILTMHLCWFGLLINAETRLDTEINFSVFLDLVTFTMRCPVEQVDTFRRCLGLGHDQECEHDRQSLSSWDGIHNSQFVSLSHLIFFSLKHFLPSFKGNHVVVRTDNTMAVSPVWAVHAYMDRINGYRRSENFFYPSFSWANPYRGKLVTWQCLSHLVVEWLTWPTLARVCRPLVGYVHTWRKVWLHPGLCSGGSLFRTFVLGQAGPRHSHLFVFISWTSPPRLWHKQFRCLI